eukprot:scaffold47260_cov28-Tisochrysis_lutea.AAC.4
MVGKAKCTERALGDSRGRDRLFLAQPGDGLVERTDLQAGGADRGMGHTCLAETDKGGRAHGQH